MLDHLISIFEQLNQVILKEKFLTDNQMLATNLQLRAETGIIESLNALFQQAVKVHLFIDPEDNVIGQKTQDIFTLIESLLIKMITAPVLIYD